MAKKSCVTLRQRSHTGLMVVWFLGFDERLRIDADQLAELAQEARGGKDPDRSLKVGLTELLAELAPELPVEADIDLGVGQPGYILDMRSEREREVHLAADAFDDAADLGEVGRHG